MPKKDISPELPQDVIDEHEAFNKKLEDAIDSILGNGSEEELTQGDVVVLTALTNVAMNEKLVDSIMFLTSEEPKLEDYGGNEIEHQEAVDKFNKEKEEVGKEFNVTRERIRQIEAKALRKLKHPTRSKRLRDFKEKL